MKLRHKQTMNECSASQFNTCGIGEIIVTYDDGSMDSDYAKDFDAYIPSLGVFMDFRECTRCGLVVIDDLDINFYLSEKAK